MKTIFHLPFLVIFIFCLYLISCTRHDNPPPTPISTLSIDSSSMTLAASKGCKDSFNITSNTTWTLSGMPSWAQANVTSGSGNQKIVITSLQANSTISPVNVILTVSGPQGSNLQKTLTLMQAPSAPFISSDSTTLNFSYQQGVKDSFDVISNVAWTLSGTPSWLQLSAASGTGNQKIYLTTTQANYSTSVLSGSITLNATGLASKTIALSQAFTPLSITSFSPQHAAAGASITIAGQNFSSTATSNTVTINGKAATVTAASSNSLTVTVPLQSGSGPIVVTVGNQTATSSSFTYDKSWFVSTLAGSAGVTGSTDGTGASGLFNGPSGIATDGHGNIYVADFTNQTIRKIDATGAVTTIAGLAGTVGSADGTNTNARFYYPAAVAADASGNIYVADTYNNTIRKIDAAGAVTTIAGLAGSFGSTDGSGNTSRFKNPIGLAADANGTIYVADYGNQTIRKINSSGVVSTIAGIAGTFGSADGPGASAQFYNPRGVAFDASGNIYIADTYNHTVRKISSAGAVSTIAGNPGTIGSSDGAGTSARFYYPSGITVDANGNIYVADRYNHTVRMIDPSGNVTTIAGLAGSTGSVDGNGVNARFNNPYGIVIDKNGNLYVSEVANNTIRKMVYE